MSEKWVTTQKNKTWCYITKLCSIIPWKLPWYNTKKIVILYLALRIAHSAPPRARSPSSRTVNIAPDFK